MNNEHAVALGRIKTAKKSASSAANGRLGGRPVIPLENIECTCGTLDDKHKWTCKRKRTEYQRERRKQTA